MPQAGLDEPVAPVGIAVQVAEGQDDAGQGQGEHDDGVEKAAAGELLAHEDVADQTASTSVIATAPSE